MNRAGDDNTEPTTDAVKAVQPDRERIILDARWFSPLGGHIGVVAARTGMYAPEKGEWKAYVGIVGGLSEDGDAQHVADWGAPLDPEEALGFFPHLDITKYKKDED